MAIFFKYRLKVGDWNADIIWTTREKRQEEVFFVANVAKKIKIQIPAGKATPAPPVGTALGPAGINLGEFCTKFNDATKDKMGDILPVEISVYEDRSFDFVVKTPPAAFLIKRALKLKKGSVNGKNAIVGTLTKDQLREIAEIKLPDLNCYDIESAMNIIKGTALNMGVNVEE